MSVLEAEPIESVEEPTRVPMSREEFYALSEDSPYYEWCRGEAIEMIRPILRHQQVMVRLSASLLTRLPDLIVVTEYAIDMPDSVRVPDIMVFTDWPADSRALTKQPLVAVEILSPSTRKIDLQEKSTEYAEFGAEQYWIVDPKAPSIAVQQNIAENWITTVILTRDEPIAEVGIPGHGVVRLDLNEVIPA